MDRTQLEASLLGAFIEYDDSLTLSVIPQLAEEDFSSKPAKGAFKAIKKLFGEQKAIDVVTVSHEMGPGYDDFLRGCKALAIVPNNVVMYADILHDEARLEAIKEAAGSIAFAEKLDDAAKYISEINKLQVSRRKWTAVSMTDAANSFCDRHSATSPEYLNFGFPKLSAKLYLELGDFIILAGEPSSGKTAFAAQTALELAKKHSVGFFTLETSAEKLTDRMFAQLTRIPLPKIKTNDLGEAEWVSISEASSELYKLRLEEIPAAGMTVEDIRSFSLSRGYDIIFIDYLQIIRPDNQKASRYEAVTQISISLHTMAQENGIAVIALSQLSRPDKNVKKPVPPSMHDLRESGQVEQDADAVLLLYTKDRNSNTGPRILKVGKNKEGERDAFELEFDGGTQLFKEAKFQPQFRPPTRKKSEADDSGLDFAQVTFEELP